MAQLEAEGDQLVGLVDDEPSAPSAALDTSEVSPSGRGDDEPAVEVDDPAAVGPGLALDGVEQGALADAAGAVEVEDPLLAAPRQSVGDQLEGAGPADEALGIELVSHLAEPLTRCHGPQRTSTDVRVRTTGHRWSGDGLGGGEALRLPRASLARTVYCEPVGASSV